MTGADLGSRRSRADRSTSARKRRACSARPEAYAFYRVKRVVLETNPRRLHHQVIRRRCGSGAPLCVRRKSPLPVDHPAILTVFNVCLVLLSTIDVSLPLKSRSYATHLSQRCTWTRRNQRRRERRRSGASRSASRSGLVIHASAPNDVALRWRVTVRRSPGCRSYKREKLTEDDVSPLTETITPIRQAVIGRARFPARGGQRLVRSPIELRANPGTDAGEGIARSTM